jgi:hypothetical protein
MEEGDKEEWWMGAIRKRSCNGLNEVVKLVPLRRVADGVRDITWTQDQAGGGGGGCAVAAVVTMGIVGSVPM